MMMITYGKTIPMLTEADFLQASRNELLDLVRPRLEQSTMTLADKPSNFGGKLDVHDSQKICRFDAEKTFAVLRTLKKSGLYPSSALSVDFVEAFHRLQKFEPDRYVFPQEKCGKYDKCVFCDFGIKADVEGIVKDIEAAAEVKGGEVFKLVCPSKASVQSGVQLLEGLTIT